MHIRSILTLLLLSSFVMQVEAASPDFQPAPLRNQEMLLEASRSGIQEVKLVARSKTQSQKINTPLKRTLFRNKFWKVEGKTFDIPVRYNSKVKRIIRRLTTKKRKQLIKGLRRSGKYMPMMVKMLREAGMPLDLVYMVPAESNFNVRARSNKSAVGLWQFIASTGRIYGLKINRWIDERRDPVLSTKAAITYLKHLYGLFGDWELAMAAYNTGEGRVKRAIKLAKRKGQKQNYSSLRLPRETRNYVPAIMALSVIYKNYERYGLGHVQKMRPMDETKGSLSVAFSLEEVARRSKMSFRTLRDMNPALYLGVPPMTQKSYSFYIPQLHHKALLASMEQNPKPSKQWGRSYNTLLGNSSRVTRILEKYGAPVYFRVKYGDNLWDLARKHKTSVRRLARWNRLNSKSVLRVNQRLKTFVPTWRVFQEVASNYSYSSPKLIAQRIRVPRGGTLSEIARKYRTSVRKLMRWNKLKSPNSVRAGQKLVVGYRNASKVKSSGKAGVIRVPKNTTLSHLALRYKTSVKNLMRWNGLTSSRQLRAGMRFYVKPPSKAVRNSGKTVLAKNISRKVIKGKHRVIRVRNGDTLWGIAKMYRTTVKKLVALNELKSSSHLRPNQKLIVPYRS
ncbi:MAG: Membrane-bound lytic murein transglycosylase D [Deltaproteobacteria bacterium]|nr:Membrane-bound lytic murein transglycosylase D [Deltaproteobacteria bacterium]